jgi:hypothetical protein
LNIYFYFSNRKNFSNPKNFSNLKHFPYMSQSLQPSVSDLFVLRIHFIKI